MECLEYNLDVIGPFKLSENSSKNIFNSDYSELFGIYIFTIKYNNGYLCYYIGETGVSFFKRLKEHIIQYFGGNYRILNPAKLKKGVKEIIWNGMWRKGTRNLIPEYIDKSTKIVSSTKKLLKLFEVFVIPFESDARTRKRIEGSLSKYLLKQPPPVGSFQDDDIRYVLRKENEEKINIKFIVQETIFGFPLDITA